VQEGLCLKFLIVVWENHRVRYGRNFEFHSIKRGLAVLDIDKVLELLFLLGQVP
jgi:hypothetical protein